MVIFWAAATVIFIIIEAATVGLASIWFALGALCALIATLLGAPLWLQIVWFVVISVVTLAATRPLVKKYVNGKKQPTNADRLIGTTVQVREDVDNIAATGSAKVDGKVWSVRSINGKRIPAGSLAVVREIQGVRLLVEEAEE
ncbi:MAG: NfeD family protein [Oscillospiraceae bacterium]